MCKQLTLLLACVVVLTNARAPLAAAPPRLTVKDAEPPRQVAAPIRATLQHHVLRLIEEEKPILELWLRKQIPLPAKPEGEEFEIELVAPGTLLGLLQVHQERYDFRDEEIPPGLYTLRFAIQPEDGDHLGTAPTNTFVLLVPSAADKKVNGYTDMEELDEATAAVNAAAHPSNMNIQPVDKIEGRFPRLASHHDDEHKVIYLQIPVKFPDHKETILLTFALVYDGIGEI